MRFAWLAVSVALLGCKSSESAEKDSDGKKPGTIRKSSKSKVGILDPSTGAQDEAPGQSEVQEDETTADKDKKDKTTADKGKKDETSADKDKKDKTTADRDKEDKTTADKGKKDETSADKDKKDKTTADKDKKDKTTADKEKKETTTADKDKADKTTAEKGEKDEVSSGTTRAVPVRPRRYHHPPPSTGKSGRVRSAAWTKPETAEAAGKFATEKYQALVNANPGMDIDPIGVVLKNLERIRETLEFKEFVEAALDWLEHPEVASQVNEIANGVAVNFAAQLEAIQLGEDAETLRKRFSPYKPEHFNAAKTALQTSPLGDLVKAFWTQIKPATRFLMVLQVNMISEHASLAGYVDFANGLRELTNIITRL